MYCNPQNRTSRAARALLAAAMISGLPGWALAQQSAPPRSDAGHLYLAKFLCGPSSEAFQEGMVAGFAATAINILNPSQDDPVRFTKRVSRALPYQAAGPQSDTQDDIIGPLEAIEIECNEMRQMLPSQMTEEFRTGYLILRSEAELEVTAVYSARPRDGEISTLSIERIAGRETQGGGTPGRQADLTITDIDIGAMRNSCPQGQGSCVAIVPVTVSNIGAGDAGPFRVRVTFDPGQATVVEQDFPGLAAGASQTFDAQTPPSDNCFDPDCRICATADSEDAVPESDETNNTLCRERQG